MKFIQLTGNNLELTECLRGLSSSKSGPQLRTAVGVMPSEPWSVPRLKLARCRAIVLMSKVNR